MYMKFKLITFISIFLVVGCAKKEDPTPEAVVEETVAKEVQPTEDAELSIPSNNDVVEEAIVETLPETNTNIEIVAPESNIAVEEDVEEAPIVEEVASETPSSQTDIKPNIDFDQIFPDSVWTNYMTKRGDFLSLIAYNEYGNANEWRRIYSWNKPHWEDRKIGPNKDNPNFIYPFRELDLKKPAENAIEWEYDFRVHVVESGETLWSIAKKEYGDELAWAILFWDNEKELNENDGKIYPGMEIKVRSDLWPVFE